MQDGIVSPNRRVGRGRLEMAMGRTLRSKHLRLVVWLLAQGNCQICGKPLGDDFDVDHIRPHSDGGPTRLWNLRATHPGCNRGRRTSQD